MNARAVASLVLKLMGIYLIVQRLPESLTMFSQLAVILPVIHQIGRTESVSVVTYSVGFLIYFVACIFLVARSGTVARRLIPGDTDVVQMDMDARTAQTVAFSVVGLLILAMTFMGLIGQIAGAIILPESWNPRAVFIASVKVVLGLVLFLGADGISRFWWRLRRATTSVPADPEAK